MPGGKGAKLSLYQCSTEGFTTDTWRCERPGDASKSLWDLAVRTTWEKLIPLGEEGQRWTGQGSSCESSASSSFHPWGTHILRPATAIPESSVTLLGSWAESRAWHRQGKAFWSQHESHAATVLTFHGYTSKKLNHNHPQRNSVPLKTSTSLALY